MKAIALVTLFALATVPVQAHERRLCKGNPNLVGQCFKIHGRIYIANGAPAIRIWRVGTSRILGVSPPEDENIPADLDRTFKDNSPFTKYYGDFEVCPFTREKPKAMQIVCVESATHILSGKDSK